MADHVVDRCANRLRERRLAATSAVIEGRGYALQLIDDVVVAELVQVIRCNAGLYIRTNHVEYCRRFFSSTAHACQIGRIIDPCHHIKTHFYS